MSVEPADQQPSSVLSFSKSKIVFYILAAILFCGLVYYFSQIKGSLELFRRVQFDWLVVAIVAQVGTYVFGSLVFQSLLRSSAPHARIPLKELVQATIVMFFVNQTLPSVGVTGNMFLFSFLNKRDVAEDDALSLILVELLTFYIALIAIIVLLLVSRIFGLHIPALVVPIFVAGIAIYLFLGIVVSLLGRGRSVSYLLSRLSRIPFLKRKMDQYNTNVLTTIESPWHTVVRQPLTALRAAFFQVCIYTCDIITIVALFRGLSVPVSAASVTIGFVATFIISMLPISPGSLIVYEGSMALFYTSFGVPFAVAGIVTILYRVLSFWLPIPLGFFLYRKLQFSRK